MLFKKFAYPFHSLKTIFENRANVRMTHFNNILNSKQTCIFRLPE